jgi:di/tricarboxylate transporter
LKEKAILSKEKILMGFSNTALLTVVSLLILGQAIIQTGALNDVASLIMRLARNNGFIAVTLCFNICFSN